MKQTPNKIPLPRTVARHYSEGRYSDYPADAIFSAVNSHDLTYSPTAIPFSIGFETLFISDFNAFIYLCSHNSEEEVEAFLKDPNGFMERAGLELRVPMSEDDARIFAAIAEDEMQRALKNKDSLHVLFAVYSMEGYSWGKRHPERYPKKYLNRKCPLGLNLPYRFDENELKAFGVTNGDMSVSLLNIISFFSEK